MFEMGHNMKHWRICSLSLLYKSSNFYFFFINLYIFMFTFLCVRSIFFQPIIWNAFDKIAHHIEMQNEN
jgi:hypothetical protein